MSYFGWKPYVPVAERRRRAEQKLKKMLKKGETAAPVSIEGLKIAKSFWGQSWCTNLESYSDYANRLPRGRTYVRNGSVVDLQIAKGEITAMVAGSELYRIKIAIAPVVAARWKSICRDCAGSIDSLVELLQGRIAKGVMDRVSRKDDGLFPAPREIKLSCSCPDWADMCKHVAAAMYGVGARLDHKPELLFVLCGVDQTDLLAIAGPEVALRKAGPATTKVLGDGDMAALFGLEMADGVDAQDAETERPPSQATERQGTKPEVAVTTDIKPKTAKTKAAKLKTSSEPPVAVAGKVVSASATSKDKALKDKRSKNEILKRKNSKDSSLKDGAAKDTVAERVLAKGTLKNRDAKAGATRVGRETKQSAKVLAMAPKSKTPPPNPAPVPNARMRRALKVFA
jgi:uncharacterized Zn finger protein